MPKIIFKEADGRETEVDASEGETLLQLALDNQVEGILGDCGGVCSCATCHCYVPLDIVGEAEGNEKGLLALAAYPQADSRLACQISVTDKMDGLVVKLPVDQY